MYLNMYLIVVVLCLLSRVTSNVQSTVRMFRSPSVPSENGYVFNQFGDNSGMYAMFASENIKHNPYTGLEPFEMKSSDKLGIHVPNYSDLQSVSDSAADRIPSHTVNPRQYDLDYEISRAKSEAEYASLSNKFSPSVKSDIMLDNLKSMMHYAPPRQDLNDAFSLYESHSDYNNDDDDVRSSGRIMYDNYWPRIYHSPYEYEYKKGISDMEKAKDKRYADASLEVKPVHEHIENDIPNTDTHEHHTDDSTDNPIGGNGPFFSFVLNDYFDRNNEEDPLSFKGLDADWGKEFDHESYRPSPDDMMLNSKRDRRLKEKGFYTPINQWAVTASPQNIHHESNAAADIKSSNMMTPYPSAQSYSPPQTYQSSYTSSPSRDYYSSGGNSLTEGHKQNHDSAKHELGESKYSNQKVDYGTGGNKYEGFRDFLDSFANKFGSEDHKRVSNYEKENNENKGEKKKGFHRIYHKDEFQEDKEFYDDSNNKSKFQDKGSSNVHIGGSEAILRSQALASTGNEENTIKKTGNAENTKFENALKFKDASNTTGDKLVKFIDVAKQAAKSNNADYVDTYRV